MRHIIILLLAIMVNSQWSIVNAQMATDNSYLRENYKNSKTAKKAAARKAARKERRALKKQGITQAKPQKDKSTYYVKAKDGSVTTKDKAADIEATMDTPYLAGAVPTTTEGIVCFEQTFNTANKSKQQVFDIVISRNKSILDSYGFVFETVREFCLPRHLAGDSPGISFTIQIYTF